MRFEVSINIPYPILKPVQDHDKTTTGHFPLESGILSVFDPTPAELRGRKTVEDEPGRSACLDAPKVPLLALHLTG